MIDTTSLQTRGGRLRRRAAALGYAASNTRDGLWRLTANGRPVVAGSLDDCERYVAGRMEAVARSRKAARP
jgi:hypothetical protein